MAVRGMGHINLRASAETVERLRRFYVDAVGLREGPRPVFRSGSSGYWLYAGSPAVFSIISPSTAMTSKRPVRGSTPPASIMQPMPWTNFTRSSCS